MQIIKEQVKQSNKLQLHISRICEDEYLEADRKARVYHSTRRIRMSVRATKLHNEYKAGRAQFVMTFQEFKALSPQKRRDIVS